MFADLNDQYNSSSHSGGGSFSSSSFNSSFPSDSSIGSWDDASIISTPLATPTRESFAVKREDALFSVSSGYCTPERYDSAVGLQMSSMTEDLLSGFQDHTFLFSGDAKLLPDQRMTRYNNFSTYVDPMCESFNGNHAISRDPPASDLDLYSPTSDMGSSPTADFVVPSQTTFLDAFDMHSPMPPARSLHFELQYESPAQDYNGDFSPMDNNSNAKWYMHPSSFKQSGSASTTPSRPSSLRQPLYKDEPLQTSIALYHIQESAESDKSKADRRSARRRVKQEIRNCLLPNNIPIHTKASKPCLFQGCGKNFKRQEHLKRHERVHTNIETYPCPCCPKIFGRTDNLKYHVKLHIDAANKKSSRTEFHKDAERYYMEMSRKPRKSEVKTEVKTEVKDVKIPVRSRVLGY